MSIPNHRRVVERLAAQYQAEWSAAHRGGPDTEAFIRRLASELHVIDPRFGLNGKRGNPGDISDDAINYDGFSQFGDVDPTRGNVPVTVIDVIGGAGGDNPQAAWNPVTDPNTRPTLAAWVQPAPVAGVPVPPEPVPVPVPPAVTCQFQPFNLEGLTTIIERQDAELDAISDDLLMLNTAVEKQRLLLADLIRRLEAGFVVDANARFLGHIGGTIKLPEPKGE